MGRKALVICVDGLDPEYLRNNELPTLERIGSSGFMVEGRCVVPSVTNVNNVSIVTGAFPSSHGITANYCYGGAEGGGFYMESPDFVRQANVFQLLERKGLSSALLTSKAKLQRMLEPGTSISVAAERPSPEFIEAVGPACDIYSAEINCWVLSAAAYTVKRYNPDLIYVSTTDYMMHKYGPAAPEMREYLTVFDRHLARLVESAEDRTIYITADHGMSEKSRGVDLERYLAASGIAATFIPVIKDRYVVHHDNLGGIAYLYVQSPCDRDDACLRLREVPGVEEVLTREQAAEELRLVADRIGDIVVLACKDTVFGSFADLTVGVRVRSHGSRHESRVPILALNSMRSPADFTYNLDVTRNLEITAP